MQTNGTLVDDEWADLIRKYNVHVGVSIDGPKYVHDMHRLDKRGRSTHEESVEGIRCLRRWGVEPSVLVVALPNADPVEVYDFVVGTLEITTLDFLLPDATFDDQAVSREFGGYLCRLFDRWMMDSNPVVNLRYMKSALSLFMGGSSFLGGFGPKLANALTVLADGQIDGDDFLRVCGDDVISLGMNIFDNSLPDAVRAHNQRIIDSGVLSLPRGCENCAYARVCNGGQATHRYSIVNGFDNPSRYCSGLQTFYFHVCESLIAMGMPLPYLEETLRAGPRTKVDPLNVFPQRRAVAYGNGVRTV